MKINLKTILRNVSLAVLAIFHIEIIALKSDLLDFRISYGAGLMALLGKSPYTTYGPHALPFQYLPWFAWAFSPLSILPIQTAWCIFIILTIIALWIGIAINVSMQKGDIALIESLSILACGLIMNQLLFRVGQITILLFLVASVDIWLLTFEKYEMAGILLPFLFAKPQLLFIFLPAIILKGGKKTISFAGISFLALLAVSILILGNWPTQFIEIIVTQQQRTDPLVWNFTTLPAFIGIKENLKLANLATSIALYPLGLFAIWKYRHIETPKFLAFSLILSLLVAPYSFSYDLSFAIPALIMLHNKWRKASFLLLSFSAFIPMISKYSSGSYLVTLVITLLSGLLLHQLFNKMKNEREIIAPKQIAPSGSDTGSYLSVSKFLLHFGGRSF